MSTTAVPSTPHAVRRALIAYGSALREALHTGVRVDDLLAAGIPLADIRTAQEAGEHPLAMAQNRASS